ncbi:hypothetical protein LINPERPRIM_LOCUS39055, partial [Linum perenne]
CRESAVSICSNNFVHFALCIAAFPLLEVENLFDIRREQFSALSGKPSMIDSFVSQASLLRSIRPWKSEVRGGGGPT